MKELLVTIGLIILGGIIVTTLILNADGLQGAASTVVNQGIDAIESITWPTTL